MRPKSLEQNMADTNEATIELLMTDAKTALTLLDLADTTKIAEDRARRIVEARKAYDTIRTFLPRLSPTQEQREALVKDLESIKGRLRAAGVPLDQMSAGPDRGDGKKRSRH